MDGKEILDYIEDKPIKFENNWFFHATKSDINVIQKILNEGIKCAFLRHKKSEGGYNGKYYVSVSKKTNDSKCAYKLHEDSPIFVIDGIKPLKADNKNIKYISFMETILPFRTSWKTDEYHAFLKINASKIIALSYNLCNMLKPDCEFDVSKLYFLKELILLLDNLEKDMPIYDLTSCREIDKEKVKKLKIEQFNKKIF